MNTLIIYIDLLSLDGLDLIFTHLLTNDKTIPQMLGDLGRNTLAALPVIAAAGLILVMIGAIDEHINGPSEAEQERRRRQAAQDHLDRLAEVQEQQLQERLIQEQELHDRLHKKEE